ELALGAPEAAHAEHRALHAPRKRRLDAMAVDEVLISDGQRRGAPREGLGGGRHAELLGGEEHDASVYGAARKWLLAHVLAWPHDRRVSPRDLRQHAQGLVEPRTAAHGRRGAPRRCDARAP